MHASRAIDRQAPGGRLFRALVTRAAVLASMRSGHDSARASLPAGGSNPGERGELHVRSAGAENIGAMYSHDAGGVR